MNKQTNKQQQQKSKKKQQTSKQVFLSHEIDDILFLAFLCSQFSPP